jgi:23S rRNA (guanosine2251-2'-O)-methyltransferase
MRKLTNEELKRKTINDFRQARKLPLIIVLDNVRSLNNIGSVFRTADAFLVDAVYLCGITATPPHRDIQKTALGATESVDWKYFNRTTDAITELKEKSYTVICLEQTDKSQSLEGFRPDINKKYALVFGNEVRGVDQQVIDMGESAIEIPQYGTKHSFNIAVSAGIVLWDFHTKLFPEGL